MSSENLTKKRKLDNTNKTDEECIYVKNKLSKLYFLWEKPK